MRRTNLLALLALLVILCALAAPLAQADSTIVNQDSTVTVPGGEYVIVKSFITSAEEQSSVTYFMYTNQTSEVDQYRVLVLDQENYLLFRSGQAYLPYNETTSIAGVAVSLVAFNEEGAYYLLVDNTDQNGKLVVNYSISYRNLDFFEYGGDSLWWLLVAIPAGSILVLVLVWALTKKRVQPPVPPSPPT